MRTSFHHQPEAQHPKSSAINKPAGRLPQLVALSGHRSCIAKCPLITQSGHGPAFHVAKPKCRAHGVDKQIFGRNDQIVRVVAGYSKQAKLTKYCNTVEPRQTFCAWCCQPLAQHMAVWGIKQTMEYLTAWSTKRRRNEFRRRSHMLGRALMAFGMWP